jgi:predicted MFS family arabinose efflux permease
MVAMAAATVLLAFVPDSTLALFTAATFFGASYIVLTGVLLLWSIRIYPGRSAFGVGLTFLMIAVGQTVGAPLVGVVTDGSGAKAAFLICAGVGLLGALVRPAAAHRLVSGPPAREQYDQAW